jgi:GNAT superfamily N-acetyltransferase
LRRLLRHHDLIVFDKALPSSIPQLASSFSLAAHGGFSSEVRAINDAFDRGFSEERLRARFEHGLRLFVLREEGRVVATTWVIREGERFIDEAGAGIAAGNGVLCLRDVFVSASERGKGRFAILLDAVLARAPGALAVRSVVDRGNRSSRRAHERYGFRPAGRIEVVHLLGRLMLRLRWPAALPVGSSFGGRQRVVRTGEAYRRFVAERRA